MIKSENDGVWGTKPPNSTKASPLKKCDRTVTKHRKLLKICIQKNKLVPQ